MTPIGIIIVDYKSASDTIRYINNEISKISYPYRIAIVNNAATAASNKEYIDELGAILVDPNKNYTDSTDKIFIIPSHENLGFAKGNNLGADFIIKNFKCEYLLFSNNDIIIKHGDIVKKLIEKIEYDSNIGLIGPEVIGLNGERQSPEPFIPMSDRYVWMYILTPFISKDYKRKRFKLNYASIATEGYHYRVMGSFFIMPAKTFLEIGTMDSNTFLYAEEMIIAERLKRIGKKVYFYPHSTVIHAHGTTTKKHLGQKKISIIQSISEKYYYTNYCGVKNWKANLYLAIYNLISKFK